MSTHRIHLRGPWDYALSVATAKQVPSSPPTGTVSMPREWREIFGELAGTAQFRRKFHRPTNLAADERVVMVCTEVRGVGRASLNEQALGEFAAEGTAVEFDVTGRLSSFNEFVVEVAFEPGTNQDLPGGLFGVVAIEIRNVG